jgi:hypothetical protein
MSDETYDFEDDDFDLEAIGDAMAEAVQEALEAARSGVQPTELLVALLHRVGQSPVILFCALEHGDEDGIATIEGFCADAHEHLEPDETVTIESYGLVGLLAAYHAQQGAK